MLLFFLLFFLLSSSLVSSGDHSLDRDLVNALSNNLEPEIHELFRLFLGVFSRPQASHNDLIPLLSLLSECTKSPHAKFLLNCILPNGEEIGFGDMPFLGFGDKYRSILTLAQPLVPAFDLAAPFDYHIKQWLRINALERNLKLSRSLHKHEKPLKILEDITLSIRFDLEKRLAKFNETQKFLHGMEIATAGVLVALPISVNPKFARMGTELAQLLHPKLLEYITSSPFTVEEATEHMLPLIKPAIYGEYFRQAYTFWQHFVTANSALTQHGLQYSLLSTVPPEKQSDVVRFYRERIAHVRTQLPKIFQLDHRLSPYFMLASWNLMQFFKYASRLVPSPKLRVELEELVLEYGFSVDQFIFQVSSQISITQKLDILPGRYRFRRGPKIRDIIILPSPLPSGGDPFYHIALTEYNADNMLLVLNTSNLARVPWVNLLIVISEPAFYDQKLFNRFIDQVIKENCTEN